MGLDLGRKFRPGQLKPTEFKGTLKDWIEQSMREPVSQLRQQVGMLTHSAKVQGSDTLKKIFGRISELIEELDQGVKDALVSAARIPATESTEEEQE